MADYVVLADGKTALNVNIATVAPGAGGTLSPKGNAMVSVTTSSQTITQLLAAAPAQLGGIIPAGSLSCRIQPRGAAVQYTDDSQPPVVAGLGTDIFDGQCFLFEGAAALAAVKLIAASATPCNLAFYG